MSPLWCHACTHSRADVLSACTDINVDTAVSSMGSIVSRATPALSSLMQSVAKQVPMPPCVGVNNTDPATSPVQLCKPEDYAAGACGCLWLLLWGTGVWCVVRH